MLCSRLVISGLLLAAPIRGYAGIEPQPQVPEYEWIQVSLRAPFAARDGAGALVFKNKMWLLGGWNPRDKEHFPRICSNDIWTSTNGAAWSLLKPNSFLDGSFEPEKDWEGRHTAGYVVFQNKLWIVGGDPIQKHYQSDVWNSADGTTWNHINPGQPVPWGPRVLQYTVAFKNKLWVMGGQTTPQFVPGKEVFYRDVWNSSDGVHWEQVIPKEPFWPQRGLIGGSAVFKDRIWILGGGTYDTPGVQQRKYYNDVWSSADGVNWTCHLQAAPWAPREYHDVAVFDDRLWVCEGFHEKGGNRNDVWHSADGVHWREVPNTPWKPRHAASLFVHDNALWMVAGNNMEPDVWKLIRKRGQGAAAALKPSPPLILVGQTNVVLSGLHITNLQGSGIALTTTGTPRWMIPCCRRVSSRAEHGLGRNKSWKWAQALGSKGYKIGLICHRLLGCLRVRIAL